MSDTQSIYRSFSVTAVITETENAKSFEIRPAGNEQITYEAGQFITLVFKKGDKEDRRSYSFSSSPALNEPMRITIKRVVNGEYSRQLLSHIKTGDTLISSGVSGLFRLPASTEEIHQFVFFAAGSGITPVYSLIRTLLYTTDLTILLVYSNYSRSEAIFYEELVELRHRFGERMKIVFLFSRSDAGRKRLSKFLLLGLLEEYSIPLQHTLFYMCGPANYMLVVSISLITVGVPEQHIRKENFNTRPHTIKPVPPDTDAHAVTVGLNKQRHVFNVQYPDTILAAAKKLNIHLPYSCEAGNCGSCMATCTQGSVWMAYNEVLTDEEISKGKVLTCQAYPVGGDVVLQF